MATKSPIVGSETAVATHIGGDDTEALMTVDQLSTFMGIPKNTLYYWRAQGSGPRGMKLGKYVRYRRSDVQDWLNASLEQDL